MLKKHLGLSLGKKECPNGHSGCKVCNPFASCPNPHGTHSQPVRTLLQTLNPESTHLHPVRTLLQTLKFKIFRS
jgi:hypothetical protein